MIPLLFFLSATVFGSLVFYQILNYLFKERIDLSSRVHRLTQKHRDAVQELAKEEDASLKERVLIPILNHFRKWLQQKMPSEKTRALANKVRDAGLPFELTAVDIRILQFVLGIGFFSLLFFIMLPSGYLLKTIFFSLAAGVFGTYYPVQYIHAKLRQRKEQIELAMPDYFDMVTVSLEAGMGLDAAIAKVGSQMKGPLTDEFIRTQKDMKLGRSRREAFSDLRERVPSELFKSVMSALIQADQMGIGMTKVLRAQTVRIREMKRQSAREKAMQAPIKMMIPMVLFIFPTLFVVLLGPVVIQVVTRFL
jgi:tight adherence protein C